MAKLVSFLDNIFTKIEEFERNFGIHARINLATKLYEVNIGSVIDNVLLYEDHQIDFLDSTDVRSLWNTLTIDIITIDDVRLILEEFLDFHQNKHDRLTSILTEKNRCTAEKGRHCRGRSTCERFGQNIARQLGFWTLQNRLRELSAKKTLQE